MSETLFYRKALFFRPISPRLQQVSSPARTKQRTIVETEAASARAMGRQVTLASMNWRFSELSEWKAAATRNPQMQRKREPLQASRRPASVPVSQQQSQIRSRHMDHQPLENVVVFSQMGAPHAPGVVAVGEAPAEEG